MAAEVSVIIVNYEGRHFLGPCLAALERQEGLGFETIVVDNGSSDGSAAFVRERYSRVRVMALDRNLGFAGGNNRGAEAATGRVLVFLNNDTEVQADWLRALVGALAATPSAGMATSRIVFAEAPSVLDSAGDGLTRWGGAYKRGHGRPASEAEAAREVFGACGAAFAIRRDVFERAGRFDEDFFLSHEDVDLSYRVQLLGHGCVYVPDAIVRHAGSATLGRVSARAVFFGQRNLEWLYFKNTPAPILIRTLPGHFLYMAASGVYHTAVGRGGSFLRAKVAALRGLGPLWRKRRMVQATAADWRRIWTLLDRGWIALKWREKRFDLGMVRPRAAR
jgi:GT2 family glycosyltransferase